MTRRGVASVQQNGTYQYQDVVKTAASPRKRSENRSEMVSFELTDEQREIRDWVHSFAEKEIRPVAHQYDESEEFPWPVVKKAAEVGL